MSTNWTRPKSFESRPVVVLGGGVLGRRIGYSVAIRDPVEKVGTEAVKYVKENVEFYATRTGLKPATAKYVQELDSALTDAWLVFEAVPERLAIKKSTFADLERLAPEDAILCSNSSSYKSADMLDELQNSKTKERILNTHYLMPPKLQVVEIMGDGFTNPAIIQFVAEQHKIAGCHPYVSQVQSTGFIINRIWAAIKRETLQVLAEGVISPAELDAIYKETLGTPLGPCKLMDAVGLDTVAFIEEHYAKERNLPQDLTVDWLQKNFVSLGKLGDKTPTTGGLLPLKKSAPKSQSEPRLFVLENGLSQPLGAKGPIYSAGRILEISADGKSVWTVVRDRELLIPDGIDYSTSDGRLYFTLMGIPSANDGSIMSCNPDGADIKTILEKGRIHTPKQLTIDQKNNKIYVCDREGLRVMRCNLDGSALETIVETGKWESEIAQKDQTNWCVGISVSLKYGKIYWTQKGPSKAGKGRLLSAKIPSNNSVPISESEIRVLFKDLPEPIDLEIDEKSGSLYWTDRGEFPLGNTLNKVSLDGHGNPTTEKYTVVSQNFDEAIGAKLYGNNMFVSDLGGTVSRVDLETGTKTTVFQDKNCSFTGLVVL